MMLFYKKSSLWSSSTLNRDWACDKWQEKHSVCVSSGIAEMKMNQGLSTLFLCVGAVPEWTVSSWKGNWTLFSLCGARVDCLPRVNSNEKVWFSWSRANYLSRVWNSSWGVVVRTPDSSNPNPNPTSKKSFYELRFTLCNSIQTSYCLKIYPIMYI